MLSRRTRSAIAAMLDVARLARGKPLPAKALAAHGRLAPRQFETVLQDLVRAGLLRSVRGPHGGYELARERRRISLGDVARAIEAPDDDMAGTDPPVSTAIRKATAVFLAHLDQVTIEILLRDEGDGAAQPPATADFHI